VPELKKLDARSLHQPEKAAPLLLQAAGVELTKNYPLPIVEHSAARLHFLEVAKAHLK
jgi:deoxyribodipyrimidine photo-lyase